MEWNDGEVVDEGASGGSHATAIVCEDDRVARALISELISARGGQVLAETDQAPDAIALIERFKPTLVVTDLALAGGTGMEVVDFASSEGSRCQVVVFTSYDSDIRATARPRVRVVAKPDFELLERALSAAMEVDHTDDGVTGDRRQSSGASARHRAREAGGPDDPSEFYRLLGEAIAGDSLLVIPVPPSADGDFAARRFVELTRAQDRVIRRRDCVVVLLTGGGGEAVPAVLRRASTDGLIVVSGAKSAVLEPAETDPVETLVELLD